MLTVLLLLWQLNVLGKLNELKDVITGGYQVSATDDKSGVLQQVRLVGLWRVTPVSVFPLDFSVL